MNYNLRKKRREKNNKVVIGIIIVISLIISIYLLSKIELPILSNISHAVINSIDNAGSAALGVCKEGFSYFGNTKKLNAKVQNLEQELEKMSISLQEINTIKAENDILKETLEIKENYNHFEKVYANIITRSYDNWNETFVINKGKNDGIKEKQTVISKDGLVGYVSYVDNNTSVVTTILDSSSAVSVEISNINKLALVKGEYSLKHAGQLKLVNVPIDTELVVGDTVYSSGIGELYKKGIPIGKITEVISKKNDIDRYGIVNVFADINSLEVVGIITN